ncbi:SH3 and PX domain-containing protein 2A [Gastrophryne carolinensis]
MSICCCFYFRDYGSSKRKSGADGNSEPMILEQYVVVSNYEKQENSEISLKAGELVDVIEKNESGWWFVSTAEEQGWVPATYLDCQSGSKDDSEIHTSKSGDVTKRRKAHLRRLDRRWTLGGMVNRQQSREEKYVTIQPYACQGKDEIGFEKGATVEVIQKNLEGWWYIRYQGKEGWAPASYLRKAKDDLPCRKKNLGGPVEIIGNIMEISNLLNKKTNEKDGGSETEDPHITKKEISLPILCNDSNGNSMMSSEKIGIKTTPGSPAVARIAPQRSEISSPNLRMKPPPRRESSLGFQLPKPPEPPSVEVEYYTIADFQSCISDGISFRGGQKADVVEKNSGGWWYVQIGEKEGWAPCSYIDKRKKPNLNRRTSTLTRPKVPPPAPPTKPKDPDEVSATGVSCSGDSKDSPLKQKYEEPEYDVPAFGFDTESDGPSSFFQSHIEDEIVESMFQPSKPSPVSSLQRPKFKVGESSEDVAKEEETIYENDGFRPYMEDSSTSKESSGDSDSQRSSVLIQKSSPAAPTSKPPLLKYKSERNVQQEIVRNISFSNEEKKPRSISDAAVCPMPKVSPKKETEQKPSGVSATKAKPSVRPKPVLNKTDSQSQEKMDISTLRRQLRPTGQLRSGLKGSKSEESESPPKSALDNNESLPRRSSVDIPSNSSNSSPCPANKDKSEESNDHKIYTATNTYQKVMDSEISFPAGAKVEVLEKQDSGWWYIKYKDSEGWAPSHFLEQDDKQQDTSASEPDSTKCRKYDNKSNSLEKIEKRVQALNTINQSKKTPPVPTRPPGGFSKPMGPGSNVVKLRNGVKQVAVRPQSVFVSPPPKENNISCHLRRNESLSATDHLRSVRRNASFNTVRQANESRLKQADKTEVDASEQLVRSPQRNGIPVSTVRPKPIEKSQFIHNNLKDIYVSIADYDGDDETVGFQEGVSMEVLEKNPNGWWYCHILDSVKPFKGWVPSNYLEKKN